MISCAALERPGWWRGAGLAAVFALVLAPVLPLAFAALTTMGESGAESLPLGTGFPPALGRSLKTAVAVATVAFLAGWPCGVLAGMVRFPARRCLLAALLLPLLVPPFLWALAWSMLASAIGWSRGSLLDGWSGTVLAFQGMAFPLVFFAALAATRGIPAGQSHAARLAGGTGRQFRLALRQSRGAALLAALLAGGMSLADPGPGQILGYEGAASQILISFSAQYDFPLAARQCLAVAGIALLAVLRAATWLAPDLARGLLARDVKAAVPLAHPALGRTAAAALLVAAFVLVILPAAGLLRPALGEFRAERVIGEMARTAGNTLVYAGVAALVAVGLGALVAVCAGRRRALVAALLAGMMLVLALPPALGALGLLHLGSNSPAEFDPLLRSRFTAGLWLGLRLFPVAALFFLRRAGEAAPSWASAAAIHGMGMPAYLRRVLLPWLAPAAGIGGAAVALFAVADIHSLLLLHPPGQASLPLSIFTVMANAPESFVASLCLAYLAGAAAILTLAFFLGIRPRSPHA